MKLISCSRCGVVLNQDELSFPSMYNHDTGEYIEGTGRWWGDTLVPMIPCPVCTNEILKED